MTYYLHAYINFQTQLKLLQDRWRNKLRERERERERFYNKQQILLKFLQIDGETNWNREREKKRDFVINSKLRAAVQCGPNMYSLAGVKLEVWFTGTVGPAWVGVFRVNLVFKEEQNQINLFPSLLNYLLTKNFVT